ncbi:MAG: metalloregulator ArsR/SmtB family transcription factor [Solirubrobacteraceae bacterium]|nr:metalloregulator ArsR/SmtB family transcription factor [Solirubrobacteraceae bacterium]
MAHGTPPDPDRLLTDPAYVRTAADTLQALSTPSRLRILARLHAGPAPVSVIADAVGMEASAVSHQLRLLRHMGLVVGAREGRRVVYALHDDRVASLLRQIVAHVDQVRIGATDPVADGPTPPAAPPGPATAEPPAS